MVAAAVLDTPKPKRARAKPAVRLVKPAPIKTTARRKAEQRAAEEVANAAAEVFEVKPQAGPQETYLQSTADIAIYGGSAGSGKTWALLLEPLYHVENPRFVAVVFRRSYTHITNAGGLWDESLDLYQKLGVKSLSGDLKHTWPSGARVEFRHLQHEKTIYDWQGSQVPLIQFDELTHFSFKQFMYLLSRNRSMCGVRPYMRATCNPDADSWVAGFIAWWIDQDTGLPIPERSGVVRWFVRDGEQLQWFDSRAEAKVAFPRRKPKSVTFIGATIYDNRKLLEKDPDYLANLQALPLIERERLLGGNWKIRKSAGLYFRRTWVRTVDAMPATGKWDYVRAWDLAATAEDEGTDPDYTVGVLIGRQTVGDVQQWYVMDRVKFRGTPLEVERAIKNTAERDGRHITVRLPQDPGQAGKSQMASYTAKLGGYIVKAVTTSGAGDKATRFGSFSAQCEAGNVHIVRGAWNEDYFDTLEGFPDIAHDDDVDASADAFNTLQAAPVVQYAGAVSRPQRMKAY